MSRSAPRRGPRTGPRAPRCARSAPSGAGREVPLETTGRGYEAGDVLCFADGRRISHVALWAGAGRIVHSALSRGGVVADNLLADTPAMRRLREYLVSVRRVDG